VIIELQPDAKEPPYVQIKVAITHAIATGALSPGAPLPTIRQLAGDLAIPGGDHRRRRRPQRQRRQRGAENP
jgi:DNA-binding transcriptional MocR family regulator